jgi:Helicase conserved C-terminal domain/PLD-like domain/SNF2-related domain
VTAVVGGGRPEFATNDPDTTETVADAVNEMFEFTTVYEAEGRSAAIASAYFNVGGWQLISTELKRVGKVRLMLGAEPQRDTDPVVLRPETTPRGRAIEVVLAEALMLEEEALTAERDLTPFTVEARSQVQDMITWLRSGRVEVRRYKKEFLHGKAYVVDSPALGVIAGSSNFTYAGLAKSRELNLGQYRQSTIGLVKDWFDGLWAEAEPFDLAAFYGQLVLADDPYLVFLRMLWEAYGSQVAADDEATAIDPSMRDLLPFQKDGVGRARRILEKHNGVLIADEVGLGKTYVGGALVKDTVRARQRVLIVAPKIIRDSVWKPYVDVNNLAGWVDVISYDDLMRDDTDGNPSYGLPSGRDPDVYTLVVLDEAHTVRNTDTARAKRLVSVLKGNPRKQVVLLTATPVNNALGDLHSLLSYFIIHDDEFAEIGIPSLAAHFKRIDKLSADDLSPEALFDVLDAVAVRRTRRFVRNHYVGQKFSDTGDILKFPEPKVRRVDYDLAPVLGGFFDVFAHALGADRDPDDPDLFYAGEIPDTGLTSIDPTRLTLAGYTPSRYRLDMEFRPYEVQIAGLLRSGLLKRFESSGAAFVGTCRAMANTLEGILELIQNEGYVASGESLRDWIRIDLDDPATLDEWKTTAEYEPADEFRAEPLVADIASDVDLLREMADTAETALQPADDPKLKALADTLVQVIAEAGQDANLRAVARLNEDPSAKASRDRDDRKVVVFSYFADTIYYLRDNIDLVLNAHPDLAVYQGRVAFVTGSSSRALGTGMVAQEDAVQGFAPKTGGPATWTANDWSAHDRYDLLFATDVLSEGVNLQQAHNIINYDLPWNPMRLVQRHGRVDRIGSDHDYVHLFCFFPDVQMDALLKLEATLHRKLAKASKSIGTGKVLPGVDASDDVVFNAKQDQIKALAEGDNTLFLGSSAGLISGEEFRAMLRKAIENDSLSRHLEAMPWGVGSGFVTDDRQPGFVFCARILNRADEPVFRYIPCPPALIPRPGIPAPPAAESTAVEGSGPTIDGNRVDIVHETLASLTMAAPPDSKAPAELPEGWVTLAYKAWDVAQSNIADTYNDSLDTVGAAGRAEPAIRDAVKHLTIYGTHRNQTDVDVTIKVFSRGQASRVNSIVRSVMRDPALTDRNKTDRLIELVDELGLSAPEQRIKRHAIQPVDVHLITWMAIIPPDTDPLPALTPNDTLVVGSGVMEQARLNDEAQTGLAQEFGLLSSDEVAAGAASKVANPESLVSQWRKDGRVFAVDVEGAARYPGFQFGPTGQPLAIISAIIEEVDARLTGWGLALWFTGSNGWLGGRRPVDVIDGPDQDQVVNAMRHLLAELL